MANSSQFDNFDYSDGEFPEWLGDMDMDDIDSYIDRESETDSEQFGEYGESCRTYTARQRIEIGGESRWLKSVTSDFETYDDETVDFDDYYAVRFTH